MGVTGEGYFDVDDKDYVDGEEGKEAGVEECGINFRGLSPSRLRWTWKARRCSLGISLPSRRSVPKSIPKNVRSEEDGEWDDEVKTGDENDGVDDQGDEAEGG